MKRFAHFKLKADDLNLSDIIDKTKLNLVEQGRESGFEIVEIAKSHLNIRWFERVVVTKVIENSIFGEYSYDEVKFVSFDFIFDESLGGVIVVNPPVSKVRLHRALAEIVEYSSMTPQALDLCELVTRYKERNLGVIRYIESGTEKIDGSIALKMLLKGKGDLIQKMIELHPNNQHVDVKNVQIDLLGNRELGLTLTCSKSGLFKISEEVSSLAILDIVKFIYKI